MLFLSLSRWMRFGAAIAVPAALLAACSEKREAPAMPPLPVAVIETQPVNLPAVIEVMGQMEGAKETEVRPRVSGTLVKRLYVEGSKVQAGQPLFQIDKSPYLNALAESRARAQQTAREEARLKGLIEHNAVSRKEYEDATSANAMAQAALEQAKLNLSWTTVVAPVAGVSGRSTRSEGNLVSVGDPLALTTISQSNLVWVRFGLSESDIASLPGGRLKEGEIQRVELVLPDGSVYAKTGKINFFASTIDTMLGTRQLRAEFDNGDEALLPGQFVRVRLTTGERQGVYLIPQAAVIQTELARLVMLVDEQNKAVARPVVTGEWQGKNWVVMRGLKPGDKVIVDNLIKLRPGAPVMPRGAGTPPGSASAQGQPSDQAPEKTGAAAQPAARP